MSYPETLYTALVCFFTGAAAGCGLCMLAAVAFHRLYRRWRFSLLCVFLSAAVVSLVPLLILTPFYPAQVYSHFMIIWCVSFFLSGVIFSVYYRIILPAAVLYCIFSFCSYYTISRKYPLPRKKVCVVVRNGSFSSDTFSEKLISDASGTFSVALDVCEIPSELLLPFPRHWYAFHRTVDSLVLVPEQNTVFQRFFRMYTSYMTGRTHSLYIPVPTGSSAAVYTLDCGVNPPVLVRIL
jgi:hypothetical protein